MQDCILKSSKYNEERKEKPKEEEIFDFKMQSQATGKNFIFPKCSKKHSGAALGSPLSQNKEEKFIKTSKENINHKNINKHLCAIWN